MKKLAILLALLLPALVSAESGPRTANFTFQYDLDSATLTFCQLKGQNGDPFGGSMDVQPLIKTTGSSTSVVANTAGQLPFAQLVVGDVIFVTRPSGVVDRRVVATKTDGDTITVNVAVDWTGGFKFRWMQTVCGTTAADGWIDASYEGYSQPTITVQVDQANTTTGIDWAIFCKSSGPGASPTQIYPSTGFITITNALVPSSTGVIVAGRWSACRVGMKLTSTDDGGDTGANAEQITAIIVR